MIPFRKAHRMLAVLLLLTACQSERLRAQGLSAEEVVSHFDAQAKRIVTFIGFSGAGYEDQAAMLAAAEAVLKKHDPRQTIVNIGATPDGIGAVYPLAKKLGFETSGIVSTQARKYEAAISPHCDRVFYVSDDTWGGFLEGTERLSPTSEAMVKASDVIVAIGGGQVGRDEMIAARKLGKPVTFIAADMNHQLAIDKARKKGQPVPTTFGGDAFELFGKPTHK